MLRENFISGSPTKKESTNAHEGGGLTRSTNEAVITSRGGKGLSQSEQPTRLRGLQGESPCAVNCLFGRLAYSRHAEVTMHEVLGRKSHCPLRRVL